MKEKIIMHVDMDAFFASVEIVDNPKLRGKAVIVGGVSERGVVATCSYEARKFGVRSAMPVYKAKELCPEGIFLPGRFERYREVSKKIFDILHEVTDKIEPMSLDEGYLDLTQLDEEPLKIAAYIKNEIYKKTGLTISVGISYNMFLAKLASDWNKPNGIKLITKEMVPYILFPLSIDKVYGLGKKSCSRLNNIGIYTVKDLYGLSKELLVEFFGKFGVEIYERIRGIDKREVKTSRERKSIGKETTLSNDIIDKEELKLYLKSFSKEIANIMHSKNLTGKNINIKYKTSSFVNHTKSKTLSYYINTEEQIFKEAVSILNELEFSETIRLIGLSVSSFKKEKLEQLSMF